MAAQKLADALVTTLVTSGVKRIYGLIGDSLNPIGEAVRINGNIEWIPVRNEETAALAAGAEAEITGSLCVCAGTSGPGSVHLINGLYEANRNNVPLLAIVTTTDSAQQGLDFFQSVNPMILYRDCSIFCETLSHTSQMPRLLQEAMQTAIGNKGVAVIIIPKDVSESDYEKNPYSRAVLPSPNILQPEPEEIRKLADIINIHDKITLYCGIGCLSAADEIVALAQAVNAPTVCTVRSKFFMENNNPNNVGMNGYLSLFESKYALDNCELLILLGTDFPYNYLLPTKPTVVQVDVASKHLGRRSRLDFGINADVKAVVDALLPLLQNKKNDEHLQKSLAYYHEIENKKNREVEAMNTAPKLQPQYLTHILSRLAEDNAVFVIDVGLNDIWAARYLEALGERVIMGSFKHGTMAAAIPEAIGAGYADPDRQIIALAGDGGLTMLMGDLLTVIQQKRKLKIIVYNNGELGFIKKEAIAEKIPPYQIGLQNPDFAKIAEVMGFKSFRLEKSEDVEKVLREALLYDGPVLIDAVTDSNALG